MKPKEMVYKPERKIELLYNDIYKGYHYYILSLGTHPTAYVEITKNHKFYNKKYWEIEDIIDCHGGLSYSGNSLQTSESTTMEGNWFIGWDYAHYYDYYCFPDDPIFKLGVEGKKWTTEEIIDDCKDVIEQLKGEE